MKNFINIKKIAVGGTVAATILAALVAFNVEAWGPQRVTFTNEKPASYVTFNSIIDNAGVGDERNFVRIKEAGSSNDRSDSVIVEPGKTYEVYIYYHNNAASNYNLTAIDTRVYSYFPSVISASNPGIVGATISAKNANPTKVWDEATFMTNSAAGVMLTYVENSAVIHQETGGAVNNMHLSEELFATGGTLIGYDSLNGEVPGCAEYSGYITYNLKAEQATAFLSKMVSKDGEHFYDEINATVGDILTYQVEGKNVGSADLTVTSIHDLLADGLEPVGTAVLTGTRTDGSQVSAELDNFFTATGDPAGNLTTGGSGWTITYQAKVTNAALGGASCGSNRVMNGVYMSYALKSDLSIANVISNHAAVTVTVACPDEVTEMPKTGADAGEMVMTMLIVISAMGGVFYMIHGIKIMRYQHNEQK